METVIAVVGVLLMVGGLALGLLRWERRQRREKAARREVLRTLGEQFHLQTVDAGLEGRIGRRRVRVTFEAEYLLADSVSLGNAVLPRSMRVCEFADGPYQKQEELHRGGAHVTGDPAFDSKFLVYGTAEQARALPAELRQLLLERPLEGLSVSRHEVRRFLPWDSMEAVSALRETLAFCDALEEPAPSPS